MIERIPARGLTLRAALLLGFGLTIAIWALAGYRFTQRIADSEDRTSAINARYIHAQELLAVIRTQVLVGSVDVREALLDPDPGSLAGYRAQFDEAWGATQDAVGQYVPVVDSTAERDGLERLRRELAEFHATMVQVLGTDPRRWPINARLLLRGQVIPKRDIVLRVSDEVQSLNRRAFVERQTDIATVYAATQRRMWEILGLALVLTLGIAVGSTRYASRLERRIVLQSLEQLRATDELQRLSSQLIHAQEAERRHIARELHDEVGQVLTAIKMELAVAQRAIQAGGDVTQPFEHVRRITEGALHSVRDLSHVLHPAMLDDFGLPAAVDWYLRGVARRGGIGVELLHEGMQERLAADIELAAYRMVQEAVTNVIKHAHATSCRVYLQRMTNTLLVTVDDDGLGFNPLDPGAPGEAGLGLVSIRERVSQLSGTFRLESAPGKGTRLTVELPARPRRGPAEGAGEETESTARLESEAARG